MKINKVVIDIQTLACILILVLFLMILNVRLAHTATILDNVSVISGNWASNAEYSGISPIHHIDYIELYECSDLSPPLSLEFNFKDVRHSNRSLDSGAYTNCASSYHTYSSTYYGNGAKCGPVMDVQDRPTSCYTATYSDIYYLIDGAYTEGPLDYGIVTENRKFNGTSKIRINIDLSKNSKIKLYLYGSLGIVANTPNISPQDFKVNNISPKKVTALYGGVNFNEGRNVYSWQGLAEWEFEFNNSSEFFDLVPNIPYGHGGITFLNIKASVAVPICDLKITSLTGTSDILSPYSGGKVGIKGTLSDSSNQPLTWTLNILDQTFTGSSKSVNEIWNGKYADGTIVEEGEYSATLTAQTADGKCTDSKTINFTVTKAEDGQCGLYVQFGSSAHMASGNLSHSQELFSSRGGALPAGMSLYYNSLDPAKGSLGRGWSHNYDLSLKENSNGSVLISEGNWRHKYYSLANGVYTGRTGNYSALVKNADGTFTLTHKDGQMYTFANGKIATIADRNGNTTTFAYSGGNLATVTDPSGRVITFTYDSANHLTSLTDPSGNAYAFTVGDALTSVTQPDGGVWRYTYDANSFMLTKADPLGNVTSYAYDVQHRVTTSTDPEGKTRSIAYPQTSDSVKSTSFTEKDGGVWNYSYDTQTGYLLAKTDPQGGTTSYGYDANGNRTATANPDGTGTAASYDTSGNMLTSTDALGQTTSYAYNPFGQVTTITDPQGGMTSYGYDAKGNMTGLIDVTGATTTYAYDSKGNVVKVTDPAGQATSFVYDAKGNLAMVTDSSGATTSYAYDAAGNVTSVTDASGAITRVAYDARNRLIKTIDPNGNVTLTTYDANGNKTNDTDANGNVTRYEYNAKNQLIKTIDALNNATTYSYGGSSCPSCGGGNGEKLTALTDANGNSTSYLYDQLGRLEKETDPKGNETGYAYDARNNLVSKTDGNGNTITYSYDVSGRLVKKKYPDNTEETFTYDAKGNILSATNKDIAYNFSYDAAGRMTSSTDSNSRYLQYSYDNTGRKTKTIYPEGSVVNYGYDGTGRLATITNGGGRTYSYSYDKLGRRSKLTYPNGATANYGYDMAGRLTNLIHKTSSDATIASYVYTLDKVGNRLSKTDNDTTTYQYDAIYRLLNALPVKPNGTNKTNGSGTEDYSYDPVGNRITGPQKQNNYSYSAGNQLATDSQLVYGFDNNGNMTAKGKPQTASDNTNRWSYSYDFENRLIKAESKFDHDNVVVSFKYDPLGRRIEKRIEDRNKKPEDATVISYVYDGQAIILQYEATSQKSTATKFVHGPNIDEPLAMQRDANVYFYYSDGLGSITALTDAKQKTIESYSYDSFGNLKNAAKPMQPFTYTGRIWDAEIGLYDYRARTYAPSLGRFIQKDPIGFAGGDANLYGYTQQNPVNYTDPTGLLTSAGALAHYLGGSGTALSMQFNEINTSSVRVTRFLQVQSELKRGCGNRTVRIDSRSSYSTSGDAALTVGGITLRLQGTLTICGCNWSFEGNLRSFDDTYDFNPSTHRSLLGELLTTVGNNLPGKTYTINILGEKPVSTSGTLK